MIIDCPISLGELVDKITILRIKLVNITDETKLSNIKKEEGLLTEKLNELNLADLEKYLDELQAVNQKLWKIEDDIRDKERSREFDQDFIKLARSVYVVNDQRFQIKNQINKKYNSNLVEEKSYKEY